jgi:hypothetical protein
MLHAQGGKVTADLGLGRFAIHDDVHCPTGLVEIQVAAVYHFGNGAF